MNPNSTQKRIAFGYNRFDDKIVINEAQAAAVKLIYNFYYEGRSIADIKATLEGCNIPSPQNKSTWGKQTISNILSNSHYLGSNEYPQIIEQEMFDAVQERKRTQAQRFSHN